MADRTVGLTTSRHSLDSRANLEAHVEEFCRPYAPDPIMSDVQDYSDLKKQTEEETRLGPKLTADEMAH